MNSGMFSMLITVMAGALVAAGVIYLKFRRSSKWLSKLPYASSAQRKRWKYSAVIVGVGFVAGSGYCFWAIYWAIYEVYFQSLARSAPNDEASSVVKAVMAPLKPILGYFWYLTSGRAIWEIHRTFKLINESKPRAKKDGEGAS